MKLFISRLKETVKDTRGSIEILMLLCCLVAVIAFINFSLGIITLGVEVEPATSSETESKKELDDLDAIKKQKSEELRTLEQKLREREKEIAEKNRELDKLRETIRETGKNEKAEYRNKLNDQLIELERQIQQKEKELEEVTQTIERLKKAQEKEKDIKKLQDELEETKKKTEEKKKELEQMPPVVDGAIKKDAEELKKDIKEAEKKKKELEDRLKEDRDIFNPWKDFKGTLYLNTPLFVECKKEFIKLYPYERTINISELDKRNPFSEFKNKHDGIVLLVRPDGFKVFEQILDHAKKTGLKIAYEPVESKRKLDFSKKVGSVK